MLFVKDALQWAYGSALDSGFEGGREGGDHLALLHVLSQETIKLDHNSSLHPGQGHSDPD